MKKQYEFAPRLLGCVAMFAWGCAAPVAPEAPEREPGPEDMQDDGPDPTEALPGVTPVEIPPSGCLGTSRAGALSLVLDAEVGSVRLTARAGKLLANGVSCSDADDVEIPIESLVSLQVTGDQRDNAVILDLGAGDWSKLLAIPESIQVSLKQGKNSLVVRGTAGADLFQHGMRGADLALDLFGDGRINVIGQGVSELGLSLGDGDDRLDDLAAFLAAAAAELPEEASAPTGEPPITALSLPLIAVGGSGNDWLLGGLTDDDFDGGPGDDFASGLEGDDTCRVADALDGSDTFQGGPGYDYVSYELRTQDLTLFVCTSEALLGCSDDSCGCGDMSGEVGENDRLIDVEDLSGGEGNDSVSGSDAAESLSGGPGDDSLFGLGGSDVLYGQRGADRFDGGLDGDYCDADPSEQISGCEL
jgi:hemolysin type calcium-binding protein